MDINDLKNSLQAGAHLKLNDGVEVLFEAWRRDRLVVRRPSDSMVFTISHEEIERLVSIKRLGFWELLGNLTIGEFQGENIGAMVAAAKVNGKHTPLVTYGSINAIPYLFQYAPLFALRKSPWGRILVADETGLGKTIEAGIVLEELFRSRQADEVICDALVIGPAGLYGEWESKLSRHFGRSIRQISGPELIERLKKRHAPDKNSEIFYLSMDSLPRMLDQLQDLQGNPGGIPLSHLFDMVVVDEAHHFKNPSSKRGRALHYLLGDPFSSQDSGDVPRIPKLLLLTATPLSTNLTNLVSYFDYMDPGVKALGGWERRKAAFEIDHKRVVEIRRIANLAIRVLSEPHAEGPLSLLRERLGQMQGDSDIHEIGIEEELEAALATLHQFSKDPTSVKDEELAEALLSLDPWSDFIIRNTRKGVNLSDGTKVTVENHPVELTSGEQRKANIPLDGLHPFAQIALMQLMSSSIPAFFCRDALKISRDIQTRDFSVGLDDFSDDDEKSSPRLSELLAIESEYGSTIAEALKQTDSKYEMLLDSVLDFFDGHKQKAGLLFTRYTTTGEYLRLRLQQDLEDADIDIYFIHGGIAPKDRHSLIEKIQEGEFNGKRILILFTEVGQEGIDLQFATGVFHYDLPWNPMRIIQRNGRVHRIGQKAPEVFIHTFFVEGLVDDRIAQAIARRMKMVYDTFGDLPDGLIGINPSDSLKSLIGEGVDWKVYSSLRGVPITDLSARIRDDAELLEEQTAKIRQQTAQIQKLIEDEADSTRAWYPLLREALHGSRGSMERVLRWDIGELLTWAGREPRLGLSAKATETGDIWNIHLSGYVLPAFEGMMKGSDRRRIQEQGHFAAYLLPDEGGRRPDLNPSEILHVGHPIVIDLAERASKLLSPPLALATSASVSRLTCLVCLEFRIEEPQGVSTETHWFLLEEFHGKWRPLPFRGDTRTMESLLGVTGPWNPRKFGDAPGALGAAIRGTIYDLQEEMRRDIIERRRASRLRRLYREWRQWRPIGDLRAERLEEAIQRLEYFQWRLQEDLDGLKKEYGQDRARDFSESIKSTETALKGLVTRRRREATSAQKRIGGIRDAIARSKEEEPEGIRVALKDEDPLALVLLCPE